MYLLSAGEISSSYLLSLSIGRIAPHKFIRIEAHLAPRFPDSDFMYRIANDIGVKFPHPHRIVMVEPPERVHHHLTVSHFVVVFGTHDVQAFVPRDEVLELLVLDDERLLLGSNFFRIRDGQHLENFQRSGAILSSME